MTGRRSGTQQSEERATASREAPGQTSACRRRPPSDSPTHALPAPHSYPRQAAHQEPPVCLPAPWRHVREHVAPGALWEHAERLDELAVLYDLEEKQGGGGGSGREGEPGAAIIHPGSSVGRGCVGQSVACWRRWRGRGCGGGHGSGGAQIDAEAGAPDAAQAEQGADGDDAQKGVRLTREIVLFGGEASRSATERPRASADRVFRFVSPSAVQSRRTAEGARASAQGRRGALTMPHENLLFA